MLANLEYHGRVFLHPELLVLDVGDAAQFLCPLQCGRGGFRIGRGSGEGFALRPGIAAAGDLPGGTGFAPSREAGALVAVGEATVVGVIVLFTLEDLHGVGPCHGFSRGAVDGPEVGFVGLCNDVSCERFAVGFHLEAAGGGLLEGQNGIGGQRG